MTFRIGYRTREASTRRGLVLLLALGVLFVGSLFVATLVSSLAAWRQSALRHEHAVQSGWLAEAGLRRGASRLGSDENYVGETWNISAEQLGGLDGAEVQITVVRDTDSGQVSLAATAEFPAGDGPGVRTTRKQVFPAAKER